MNNPKKRDSSDHTKFFKVRIKEQTS